MKKYVFISIFMFMFFIGITKASASIVLVVDEDGSLYCNSGNACNVAREQNWFHYEDNTLYIDEENKTSNYTNYGYYSNFEIYVNSPSKIVVADNAYIYSIIASADIQISSKNKEGIPATIEDIVDNDNNEDDTVIFRDANIKFQSSIGYFKNVEVYNSNLLEGVARGSISHPQYSSYVTTIHCSEDNECVSNGRYYTLGSNNDRRFIVKDSNITAGDVGPFSECVIEDSTLNTTSLYIGTNININNANIESREINFINGYDDGTSQPNKDKYEEAIIDNSTINARTIYNSVSSSTINRLNNKYKFKFNNCEATFNDTNKINFYLDKTNLNVNNKLSNGFINAIDSEIEVNELYNNYYFNLNKTHMKVNQESSLSMYNYPPETYYDDYNLKLLDSSFDSQVSLSLYNLDITNSYLKTKNINVGNCSFNSCGSYIDNNKANFNNSTIDIAALQTSGDVRIINSDMKSDAITTPLNIIMQSSKLVVNTSLDIGVDINDLEFNNSYLLAKASVNAWISDVDITTHNLAGINEEKTVIPMQANGSTYSFYDNGIISNYVEIKTPLKVTFKIKNGTWADGTTEDKYIETYYFGSIKDVDVPKDMIANYGYSDGSWDKEIIYDEIKDEYVYTYTFKDAKAPKKDNKKEKKEKLKNPDTGAFLSIMTVGILSVICIKILQFVNNKKPFNKI